MIGDKKGSFPLKKVKKKTQDLAHYQINSSDLQTIIQKQNKRQRNSNMNKKSHKKF